jgi:hypothetical protein
MAWPACVGAGDNAGGHDCSWAGLPFGGGGARDGRWWGRGRGGRGGEYLEEQHCPHQKWVKD